MAQPVRITKRLATATACVLALTFLPPPAPALAADLAPGDILLADAYPFPVNGAAFVVDPITGDRTALTGTFDAGGNGRDIAYEGNGADSVLVLVSLLGSAAIVRVDPSTGTQTTVTSGPSIGFAGGIVVEADGMILVTTAGGIEGASGIVRVDPTTGAQTVLSAEGLFETPSGVALEADGSILVADANAFGGPGGIISVDPSTGAQTTVSAGGLFDQPFDVAVEADGNIVVADPVGFGGTGAIYRVDPTTGAQTLLATGGDLVDPVGIAVEASGAILVSDFSAFSNTVTDTGAIFRLDPVTGTPTVVSAGTEGNNALFNPIGIGLVPPNVAPTLAVGAGVCPDETDARAELSLAVADEDGQVDSLVVTATSSNQVLLPDAAIVVGGSGADRTLSISAVAKETGTAIVTVSVTDGFDTATTAITVVVGTAQADTIAGTAGPDVLFGMQGADTLSGDAGGDLLCGANGTDTILGGEGDDSLDGGHGNDVLSGGDGDDTLGGGDGDDVITGGAGADSFSGGRGVDSLADLDPTEGDTHDGT